MIYKVEVCEKQITPSRALAREIKDLGIEKKVSIYSKKIYFIEGEALTDDDINNISSKLLIDSVTETFSIDKGLFSKEPQSNEILIVFNPGVFDVIASSLRRAIKDLSLEVKNICTAKYYKFEGLDSSEIQLAASKLLYNPLIEHILDYSKNKEVNSLDKFMGGSYKFKLISVDTTSADDTELMRISRDGSLSLTIDEMRAAKDYFAKLNRNPTDCELETIAQTWSEHCAHKTFRNTINYEERDESGKTIKKEVIKKLLKSTIVKATNEIDSPDCVSVFDDNSGVVRFNEKYNVCCKVETHNHPSSLEPYGGASTGIGGVIRDILGTGLAAKPVASLDVFCFSDWHIPHSEVPAGLLHPKRIINGVYRGVRDYGNRMGIPTVAGAVCFDERFLGNPLVYCGTVGIMPKEKSFNQVDIGDLVIVCGARTGRDGIHGATFSSVELTEDTVELTSAVQIGNPIEEKKLVEAIIRARDLDLFNAITDCGAGGLSSAVGEMARHHGVSVNLDKVPLKYKGISYDEIWISESQERMVIFIKDKDLEKIEEIFAEEEVEMAVIGRVDNDKLLKLFYNGEKVCDIEMDFIHQTILVEKNAVWIQKETIDKKLETKSSYNDDLKSVLAMPNIAPKDWIIREYDHEVQGASVTKPLLGIDNLGLSDGTVVRPDLDSKEEIALGVGINPNYSDIDPYWMAALAIDEALRNVVCCGAYLNKTFILDNFSWGSPNDEELLAGLVRASRACYDFATYFGTPFISGKDSLYNEYVVGGNRIAIPGTLLVTAMSVMDGKKKSQTSVFQQKDNLIYILGNTHSHMGESAYFQSKKEKTGFVPMIDKTYAKKTFIALADAINQDLIVSCHDCSDGGAAVAIAEMCIGGCKGANIFLNEIPAKGQLLDYELLFSESPSRFIIEVEKDNKESFEKLLENVPFGIIGCVSDALDLVVYDKNSKEVINVNLSDLKRSWLDTFKEFRYSPK